MSQGFGQYVSTDYSKIKNGTYAATIISAKVIMENGRPKLHPESGKPSAKVVFQLDEENADGAITLDRQMGLTFGKNRQTGAYANWALLVEAATGVACGDKAQGHVGERELIGKRVNVRVKNVESNGNKYSNIVDFEAIEDDQPAVQSQPRAAVPASRQQAADEAPLDDDEIPF